MNFDTHAHYDDARFNTDRDILLNSLKDHGIGTVVNAIRLSVIAFDGATKRNRPSLKVSRFKH